MEREPTEMELRVAQAICESQGLVWALQGDPMTSGSGGDDRDGYLIEARAAIHAMREPTPEMRGVRVVWAPIARPLDMWENRLNLWTAMIDAASPE